jgi:hypothetical protein
MRVVLCLTILAAAVMAGKGSSLSLRNELANALEGNSLDANSLDAYLLDANLRDDDAVEDDAGKDNAVEADEGDADDDLSNGCPPGYEVVTNFLNVTLPGCYEICADGWGPDYLNPERCRVDQKCPSGFKNFPEHCQKTKTYGRGWGKVPKFKCKRGKCYTRCDSDKERCLALCYKKCDAGFQSGFSNGHGCNICSQECPRGFWEFGDLCSKPQDAWKKIYNRAQVPRY